MAFDHDRHDFFAVDLTDAFPGPRPDLDPDPVEFDRAANDGGEEFVRRHRRVSGLRIQDELDFPRVDLEDVQTRIALEEMQVLYERFGDCSPAVDNDEVEEEERVLEEYEFFVRENAGLVEGAPEDWDKEHSWYLNVYIKVEYYGGPEEGGWFDDYKRPVRSYNVTNMPAMVYDHLFDWLDSVFIKNEYGVPESYVIKVENRPATVFPQERSHYE